MISRFEPKYLKLTLDTEIAPTGETFIDIAAIKSSKRWKKYMDDGSIKYISLFVSHSLVCIVDADGRVYTREEFDGVENDNIDLEDVKKYITPDCAIYKFYPECYAYACNVFNERFNDKWTGIVSVQHSLDYLKAAVAADGCEAVPVGCIVING